MDTACKLVSGPVRPVRDAARRHLRSTDPATRIRHLACPGDRGTAVRLAALYWPTGSRTLVTKAAAGRATGPGSPHLPAAGGPTRGVARYGGGSPRPAPPSSAPPEAPWSSFFFC